MGQDSREALEIFFVNFQLKSTLKRKYFQKRFLQDVFNE